MMRRMEFMLEGLMARLEKAERANDERLAELELKNSKLESKLKEMEQKNPLPSDFVFVGTKGKPLGLDRITQRFRRYARKAGLSEEITFHSLRHTTASWLAMRGVPQIVIQKILGHSSTATTEKYMHLSPNAIQNEMKRAFNEMSEKAGE